MFDVVLFLVSLALVGSSSQPAGNDTFFLGQSIYVPDTDVVGSVPNGIHPFSLIQEHCIQNQSLHKSVRNTNYFRDTEALYSSVATTSELFLQSKEKVLQWNPLRGAIQIKVLAHTQHRLFSTY